MKTLAILLAASTLAALSSAYAGQPAPAAPAVESSGRIVCFTEPVTGSHMRKRVCMTEEERERRRAEDQEALRKFKSGSSGRGNANVEQPLPGR